MKNKTYFQKVVDKLTDMEVDDSFRKKAFIAEIRGSYDYFADRSFTVYLTTAKKRFPEKIFKSKKGWIYRLK